MDLNRGSINGDETRTPTTASTGPEAFDHNEGVYGWSEEFECETMYGFLAPTPISSTPLSDENDMEDEEEPEPRKRRTVGDEKLFFRIYEYPQAVDQYLLEMHDVRTGRVERSHLFAKRNNGQWKVDVFDLAPNTYVVPSVLHEPFILRPSPEINLSLQDRLAGWTVEKRKRKGTGKEETFYYHGGKQYRSFVEVTTFILFSTKSKEELKNVIRNPDRAA